ILRAEKKPIAVGSRSDSGEYLPRSARRPPAGCPPAATRRGSREYAMSTFALPSQRWGRYNLGGTVALPRPSGKSDPMDPTDAVTCWIGQLQAGDRAAVQLLWERYFPQLLRLARRRLGAAPQRMADNEDVALSAFASFCRAAEEGHL